MKFLLRSPTFNCHGDLICLSEDTPVIAASINSGSSSSSSNSSSSINNGSITDSVARPKSSSSLSTLISEHQAKTLTFEETSLKTAKAYTEEPDLPLSHPPVVSTIPDSPQPSKKKQVDKRQPSKDRAKKSFKDQTDRVQDKKQDRKASYRDQDRKKSQDKDQDRQKSVDKDHDKKKLVDKDQDRKNPVDKVQDRKKAVDKVQDRKRSQDKDQDKSSDRKPQDRSVRSKKTHSQSRGGSRDFSGDVLDSHDTKNSQEQPVKSAADMGSSQEGGEGLLGDFFSQVEDCGKNSVFSSSSGGSEIGRAHV